MSTEPQIPQSPALCDLEEQPGGKLRCSRCRQTYDKPRVPPLRVNCRAAAGLLASTSGSGCCDGDSGDKEAKAAAAAKDKAEEEAAQKQASSRRGFWKLAKHFASDLGEFAKSGFGLVSKANFNARLEVCSTCEHRVGRRCDLCGCIVAARARAVVWHCPDKPDRWEEADARFQEGGEKHS